MAAPPEAIPLEESDMDETIAVARLLLDASEPLSSSVGAGSGPITGAGAILDVTKSLAAGSQRLSEKARNAEALHTRGLRAECYNGSNPFDG